MGFRILQVLTLTRHDFIMWLGRAVQEKDRQRLSLITRQVSSRDPTRSSSFRADIAFSPGPQIQPVTLIVCSSSGGGNFRFHTHHAGAKEIPVSTARQDRRQKISAGDTYPAESGYLRGHRDNFRSIDNTSRYIASFHTQILFQNLPRISEARPLQLVIRSLIIFFCYFTPRIGLNPTDSREHEKIRWFYTRDKARLFNIGVP